MGLGRDYREKLLEQEHQKYFEQISNKAEHERLESEKRFLRIYDGWIKNSLGAFTVIIVMILFATTIISWSVISLVKALFL